MRNKIKNVVAVELFRREAEMYYFKSRNECDLIVQQGRRPVQAIQVFWEINERTAKREIAGLAEACRTLALTTGQILTYAQEEERMLKGKFFMVANMYVMLIFVLSSKEITQS